jgi:uncharacterized protein (TIGR02145 family)/uncharacterized repeat protein (TIGR02543 family)
MKATGWAVAAALIAVFVGTAAAQVKRVFVADVGISASASAQLTPEEIQLVTKSLRGEARKSLPYGEYEIMTTETVRSQQGIEVQEMCYSDECVVSLGEKIGADYIVRGTINKIQTMFALSIEMNETENANLVASSEIVRAQNIVELIEKGAKACADMYRTFEKSVRKYTVAVAVNPANGGTVSRNPDQAHYAAGTKVSVTAIPASGYTFTGWSGASSSTKATLTAPVDRDLTLTANFQYIQQSVQTPTYQPAVPTQKPTPTYQPPAPTPTQTPTQTQTQTYQRSVVDGSGVLTDSRDGKRYRTVVIGGKRWMAENLNYQISSGSWCYDYSNSNCDKYGRLYDWNTAKTVCPAGFHLPLRQEWNNLVAVAGGDRKAGKNLKAKSGWSGKKGNGTDKFGVSALPGGYRGSGGNFNSAGINGNWWTATEFSDGLAYFRGMSYNYDGVDEINSDKSYGLSVRCVQN